MDDEQKGRPCPVCGSRLIPQYSEKDDFRMRVDPVSKKIRIPMRCCKCVINVDVSIDPKELEQDEEE